MRRGFKAWCENTAADYRGELGLALSDALDSHELAKHLGVLVWGPQDVPNLSEKSLLQLTQVEPGSWSAVTIAAENRHLVILNDAHAETRLNNSLAHELSHIILNHRPASARVSSDGYLLRDKYDQTQEAEADWLAGSLLVPREGLRQAYQSTKSAGQLASHFGVSTQLINWRLQMTGVLIQSRRAVKMYKKNRL